MRAVDYARGLYKYLDIENYPIDLTKLFKPLKIRYLEDEGIIATGIAVKMPAMNLIIVNSSYPKSQMRFALAHEIAHIVMPHKMEHYVCKHAKSPMENDANRFAAELLMPKLLVEKLWYRYRENKENRIELIANKLQVSKSALQVRIKKLGLK
ncbi:MAG: ImmA/IrrE family metallo-endopeptidase [Candidatus Zixiibacteriota bacterium]